MKKQFSAEGVILFTINLSSIVLSLMIPENLQKISCVFVY